MIAWTASPVAVIDDVMAQTAFGGQRRWENDCGSTWLRSCHGGGSGEPCPAVGLAADDQAQVRAQLYYPFTQVPNGMLRRWSE